MQERLWLTQRIIALASEGMIGGCSRTSAPYSDVGSTVLQTGDEIEFDGNPCTTGNPVPIPSAVPTSLLYRQMQPTLTILHHI